MFDELQLLRLGAALLLAHATLCVLLWWRSRRPSLWWSAPVAMVLVASYALNLADTWQGTVYGGLVSDQLPNLAHVDNARRGLLLLDGFDQRSAAQYPPLAFAVAGLGARLSGVDAVTAWRLLPLLVLAVLPFVVHLVGRRLAGPRAGFYAALLLCAVGAHQTRMLTDCNPMLLMHYVLVKPHELVAALLAAWLLVSFGRERKRPVRGWLGETALASLVVLLYPPWLALALAALLVEAALRPRRAARLRRVLGVAAPAALVSAPYWLGYALQHARGDAEPNAGMDYLSVSHLDPTWMTLGLGWCGGVFFAGLVGLCATRRRDAARPLRVSVWLAYGYYGSTYVTAPWLGVSLLPHRAHLFVLVALSIFGGAGLCRVRVWARRSPARRWLAPLPAALLASLLLPHLARWNRCTDPLLEAAAQPVADDLRALAAALDQHTELGWLGTAGRTTSALAALSHAPMYAAPRLVFANPLTCYRARMAEVTRLLQETTDAMTDDDAPEARDARRTELARRLRALGIDALLLENREEHGLALRYDLRLRRPDDAVEAVPDLRERRGGERLLAALFAPPLPEGAPAAPQREVVLRRGLFGARCFTLAYENSGHVLFLVIDARLPPRDQPPR